jgi:hypothetical protein
MTLELWIYVIVGVIVGSALTADALTRRTKPPKSSLGTLGDDRVAYMTVKQRALGKRMRRQGKSILSRSDYTPELTKKAEPEPVSLYAIKGGKR